MQYIDPMGSSKNKLLFKKRTHRPWKPTVMENSIDSAISEEITDIEEEVTLHPITVDPIHAEKQSELIRTQLEEVLEGKQSEFHQINEQITNREENRLLIGGFLYPRNIFSLTEEEKIEKTNFLMHELKSKEQEILLIAQDLKIAKAVEQAENSENSRRNEESARMAAEEKALFAIQQAKSTAEQVYKTEQQLTLEKQLRLEEEKIRKQQEEKLKVTIKEIEKRDHKIQEAILAKQTAEEKAKYALEYATIAEQNAKKEAHDKINETEFLAAERVKKIEFEYDRKMKGNAEKIQHAQMQAEKRIQKAQEQIRYNEKARLSAQTEMQKAIERAEKLELARAVLEEDLRLTKREFDNVLQKALKQDLDNQAIAQGIAVDLQMKLASLEQYKTAMENERLVLEEKMTKAADHLKKVESVISTEKHLRKFLEEKNIEILKHVKELEAQKMTLGSKLHDTTEHLTELKQCILQEKDANILLVSKIKAQDEKILEIERLRQEELQRKNQDLTQLQREKLTIEEMLQQEFNAKFLALEEMKQIELYKKDQELQQLNLEKIFLAETLQNEKTQTELKLSETRFQLSEKVKIEKNLQIEMIGLQEQLSAKEILLNQKTDIERELNDTKTLNCQIQETLKYKLHDLEQCKNEIILLNTQLAENLNHTQTLVALIDSERTLRKDADLARVSAEEKINRAIEQASKTVLSVLGNSDNILT